MVDVQKSSTQQAKLVNIIDGVESGGVVTVIYDILRWIDGSLDENLKVYDVTEKSGYTHWYFQRKFRDVTGISLGEYIRFKRIISAANDLVMTDKKILTIALDNGFTSQQTFTRIFRKYMDATPGDFRKRFHGKIECSAIITFKFFADFPFFRNDYACSRC